MARRTRFCRCRYSAGFDLAESFVSPLDALYFHFYRLLRVSMTAASPIVGQPVRDHNARL
jgi:hypothetical protein